MLISFRHVSLCGYHIRLCHIKFARVNQIKINGGKCKWFSGNENVN